MITFNHLMFISANDETVSSGYPVYLLTEELKSFNDEFGVLFSWVENSDPSYLEIGHGKLVHVGDGNNQSGTSFDPSNAQYEVGGGWIDLGNRPSGSGTKYIDTGWIAPDNSVWTITGVYNLVVGVSFDMYAIKYNGNNTCDIYLADQDTNFSEPADYINVPFAPSQIETWKIYEYPPAIIYPSRIEYNMSTFNEADGVDNISEINAIPVMTSNTDPIGIISVSSTLDPLYYDGYMAVDGNPSTNGGWFTTQGIVTGWFQYEFDSAIAINKYILLTESSVGNLHMPTDWTIEASNTGLYSGEEIILHTVVNFTEWISHQYIVFTFTNSKLYKFYRINITSSNGTTDYLNIKALSMIESQ